MANVLGEEKRQQVLALGRLGWTLRRIEETTGVRRETASRYLRAEGIPVRLPRGRKAPNPASREGVSTDSGEAKAASREGVSTDFGAKRAGEEGVNGAAPEASTGKASGAAIPGPGRSPAASACEPYRELIELGLGRGRNAVAIFQDLVDDHGFRAGYSSVKRFVRKLRGTQTPEARAVIVTAPGEEAQVDYGTGPMVRDPKTGKYRRTRLFVLTLGHSRKSVRLLTFASSTRIWAELHERAFRRLGGAVRVIVLDNLREGVLKPDIYDPELNPLYRDVLAHYGVVALPCRVGDPDRKGKVESGVGHAKRTPLLGLRFESLEEAQAYLDRWEHNWADTRIHGTTKRQVAVMFAEEKPHLLPLPIEPFRYYQYGTRTVHPDGCVEVEAAYYGAPPGWVGRDVFVQWNPLHVRILDPKTGLLLREQLRQKRGHHRIKDEDRPKQTPREVGKLLYRAQRAGKHVGQLCIEIHRREGSQVCVRRIQGVLALARHHGIKGVDDACAAGLEIGVPTYRFVRRYLERQARQLPLSLRQVDPLIRKLTEYRDLIDKKTKKEEGE
jgi:transposase